MRWSPALSGRWASASSRWAKFRWPRRAALFASRLQALNEEGVDLIILETFGYLEELHQAILAAREVNPDLPVVAQVTIDEDGNCLDGSSPEHYGPQLQEPGAPTSSAATAASARSRCWMLWSACAP